MFITIELFKRARRSARARAGARYVGIVLWLLLRRLRSKTTLFGSCCRGLTHAHAPDPSFDTQPLRAGGRAVAARVIGPAATAEKVAPVIRPICVRLCDRAFFCGRRA